MIKIIAHAYCHCKWWRRFPLTYPKPANFHPYLYIYIYIYDTKLPPIGGCFPPQSFQPLPIPYLLGKSSSLNKMLSDLAAPGTILY